MNIKYYNQKRKAQAKARAKARRNNISERIIDATKEMLIDKSLGYDVGLSYYEEKYNIK